jgi:hypothetical protein
LLLLPPQRGGRRIGLPPLTIPQLGGHSGGGGGLPLLLRRCFRLAL